MTNCGDICDYVARKQEPSNWHGDRPDDWVLAYEAPLGLEQEVWECPHEALDGGEYCPFHTDPENVPDDVDEGERFVEAVNEASAVDDEETARRRKEFVGATFGAFDIKEATLDAGDEHPIRLGHARFARGANAVDAVFEHSVLAALARFEAGDREATSEIGTTSVKIAEFGEGEVSAEAVELGDREIPVEVTKSGGEVSVEAAELGDRKIPVEVTKFGEEAVSFQNAKFGGEVHFDDAKFGGGASFQNAKFGGEVHFDDAKFRDGEVSFQNAKFGGEVSFSRAKFRGGEVSFSRAKFRGGEVSFSRAKFRGEVSFLRAKFRGEVSFLRAKFKQGVSFLRAEFKQGVLFKRSKFGEGEVSFKYAKFGEGEASFLFAKFGESEVSFKYAKFGEGEVSFNRAKFGEGGVSFDSATVTASISFLDTRFNVKSTVVLSDAELRNDVTFGFSDDESVSYAQYSLDFSGAAFHGELKFRSGTDSTTEAEQSDPGKPQFDFVYAGDVDFSDVIFPSGVDYSDARFPPDADFTGATLEGADFSGADVTGTDDISKAFFDGANLTGANFSHATLAGASFERARLSRAELLGANLAGVNLYGALLGDARINRTTEFWLEGDDSRREPDVSPRPVHALRRVKMAFREREPYCPYDPRYRGSDGKQDLEKAGEVYATLETLANENSLPMLASECFLGRKDVQLREYLRDGNAGMVVRSFVPNLVARYGESPLRVLATGAVTILACGLAYDAFDLIEHADSENPVTLFEALYFSALTFTTLGYGDFNPASSEGQVLAVAETSIGVVLLAILVFVFGRRATR